jgi:aryl-alcohol dehydrogenase-like predicted oxidoreductase
MELRPLGHTGVSVSQFCLGAMMFGAWGNTDHDESIRIIQRALDAGINFIDTADVYGAGESEEIVGKALAGGEDLAKALACKGSTRFGENLSSEEMEILLKEWSVTEFRETCTPIWKTFRPVLPCLADRG